MKRFASRLVTCLGIYVFFAIGMPFFLTLTSQNYFEGEQLAGIHLVGRFFHGQLSTVNYEFRGYGEVADEINFVSDLLNKNTLIRTEKENGVYTIWHVGIDNRSYGGDALRNHPEILAEAEKVLQLGRDKFAKAKKKLEQKSKPKHQPARLG